jgi:methyltransferase (TIGR00027 family)
MKLDHSSRTAEYMALFRAMESARPENRQLFADPFAISFLRPALRRAVGFSKVPLLGALLNRYIDHRLPGARTSAIARTRLIDDALLASLGEKMSQVVILGAGFDCRAYRLPQLTAATVFEVDHPSTHAAKLAGLHATLAKSPGNVRYVEIDFNRQSLPSVLAEAGFQPSSPAIFLWEGVTNYLTPAAVDAVLAYVAGCSPGSRIIFTYVHSGALDGSVLFEGAGRLLRDVATLDEPWTFGLAPDQVAEFLSERGLRLDSDLSAREYRSRYFGAAAQRMRGYDFYHVATAHVQDETERIHRARKGTLHGDSHA